MTVAGILSGILSAYLFPNPPSIHSDGPLYVGLVFGGPVGVVLAHFRCAGLRQLFGFVILCFVGWPITATFAALPASLFSSGGGSLGEMSTAAITVSGFLIGAFGAGLLAAGVAALFPWFRSIRRCLATAFVGGVAGTLLAVEWGAWYPLFIVWQGSFALCLALAFPSREEKTAA